MDRREELIEELQMGSKRFHVIEEAEKMYLLASSDSAARILNDYYAKKETDFEVRTFIIDMETGYEYVAAEFGKFREEFSVVRVAGEQDYKLASELTGSEILVAGNIYFNRQN